MPYKAGASVLRRIETIEGGNSMIVRFCAAGKICYSSHFSSSLSIDMFWRTCIGTCINLIGLFPQRLMSLDLSMEI